MKLSLFVSFLISLGFITSTTGLQCYQCMYGEIDGIGGTSQPKCQDGDINQSEFLNYCPLGLNSACLKTSIELEGVKSIVRSCVGPGASMGCIEVDNSQGKGSTCVCDSDGCNGSSSLKVTSALFLALPALFFKLYF